MKHVTSRTLHEYWVRCGGRAGVAAGALTVDLAPLLPSIFLLDVGADLRFRFCGRAIARRYGKELLGDSFLALWTVRDREQIERLIEVMAASSGLVAGVLGETLGAGFVAFEMLLLPLKGAGGVTGAIGSMERIGGHEENNRLRARLLSQTLRSVRIVPAISDRDTPAYARPATALDFRPAALPTLPRRYGHLTVFSGGR